MGLYYKPEQRVVNVEILTWGQWISGKIHIGKMNKFLDVINNTPSFLKIVGVEFESAQKWPFLALQHKAIDVIIPFGESREDITRSDVGQPVARRVICLLKEGMIEGDIHMLPDIRVSDYLSQSKYYLPIHNFRIDISRQNGKAENETGENVPIAIINKDNVVGITDV